MIGPPLLGRKVAVGAWEVAAVAAAAGLLGMGFLRALGQAAPVPVGDPYLQDSLGGEHA